MICSTRNAHHYRARRAIATLTAVLTMLATLLGVTAANAPSAVAASDSLGTDYWLAFMQNYTGGPELTLFITGATATSGTVTVPGLSFSQSYTVTPGAVTSVSIPTEASISGSDAVTNLGVHVTAGAEVSVYGLNRIVATTDAFLGLPTDILGNEYLVEGYRNSDIVNASEFAVVATQDGTTVTITPKDTVGTRTAGVPYTVTLDQGQTYQLVDTNAGPADLSGTIVTSDKPIAVFGGHGCANIPGGVTACDHLVEEMTPTDTWGKSFVTEPLATRIGGDTFRYLASTDNTVVSVNGSPVATLNRGQLFEQILTSASTITSDKPILVTQYSNGTSFDGVTSDPFEVIVPPYEQFLNAYTVTTPASGFSINYINVVAPTAAVGTVLLDGTAIPAASFTAIPGSSFSGAQLPVALGSHTLESPQPFGITVYGFDQADSYGYPGGLSLAPVATVTNVDLSPATSTGAVSTEFCSTATVTDQNSAPVVGVRVDFSVTGTNPTTGFANTAADGTAQFCYTGAAAGPDTIRAAVGTVADTSTRTWTTAVPANFTLSVSVEGSGTVTSNPPGINCPGTCSAQYPDGTSVNLTASPAAGFAFTSWSGACTGGDVCTVAMSADQSVTATFSAVSSGVSVTETSDPPTVTAGQNVLQTFTVTNPGVGALTNARLSIAFPAGATVVSSDPEQGTCTRAPAALRCSLGTIAGGADTTITVVVRVPAGFPPGLFAPTATLTSDQTGSVPAGDLPGSTVVAAGNGQAIGFVAPGGSITTGDASPAFPTAATFTLPNTGTGTPISLTTEPTTPTYCGGLPCRGPLLTLSPFGGGYDNPSHPPVLDISLDRSVVRRFGPASRVWVQKEDSTLPPQLVPDCKSLRFKGRFWWFRHWWNFNQGAKVAVPSPCVSQRYTDRNGDSHTVILILQGDPKFGRR